MEAHLRREAIVVRVLCLRLLRWVVVARASRGLRGAIEQQQRIASI